MFKAGEVYLNPVTGERAVTRIGTDITGGERMVVELPTTWWNAGTEEALVRMEMRPAARFEAMIRNAFGLAQDGKVNKRGMPNVLQLAVFAREFSDVMEFTRPPRFVQRILFGLLAPIARMSGYQGSYPEYLIRKPSSTISVAPLPLN